MSSRRLVCVEKNDSGPSHGRIGQLPGLVHVSKVHAIDSLVLQTLLLFSLCTHLFWRMFDTGFFANDQSGFFANDQSGWCLRIISPGDAILFVDEKGTFISA